MSAEPLPVTPPQNDRRERLTRARGRALLSLVPSPVRARRAPFVALLLALLAGGLVGLLLLNTASAQDSFRLHALQDQAAAVKQELQLYSGRADGLDDPATLYRRAAALGMVPGGTPVFLAPGQPLPKGAIRVGTMAYIPGPIQVPTPPPTPTAPPSPQATATTPVKAGDAAPKQGATQPSKAAATVPPKVPATTPVAGARTPAKTPVTTPAKAPVTTPVKPPAGRAATTNVPVQTVPTTPVAR